MRQANADLEDDEEKKWRRYSIFNMVMFVLLIVVLLYRCKR